MFAGERARTYDSHSPFAFLDAGEKGGRIKMEIDDSQSRLRLSVAELCAAGTYECRIGDFIHHPRLFEAYPQYRDRTFQFTASDDDTAAVTGRSRWDMFSLSAGRLSTPHELRLAALHELQHMIEETENYQPGGEAEEDRRQAVASRWRSLQRSMNILTGERLVSYVRPTERLNKYREMAVSGEMNRLARSPLSRMSALSAEMSDRNSPAVRRLHFRGTLHYLLRPGEVWARTVEARAGYTLEQRLAVPPTETMRRCRAHAAQLARREIGYLEAVTAAGAAPLRELDVCPIPPRATGKQPFRAATFT